MLLLIYCTSVLFFRKKVSGLFIITYFARLHTLLTCVKQLIHGRKERTVTVCDKKNWTGWAGSNLRRSAQYKPISDALAE